MSDSIPIGAHLVSPRSGFYHHGIYVGNGKVVHYSRLANGMNEGPVEEVTLKEFLNGWIYSIQEHINPKFSTDEIVSRACSRIGENLYDPGNNNCEQFCNKCIDGDHDSMQVTTNVAGPMAAGMTAGNVMFCSKCGKENSNDTKFCGNCGTAISAPSVPGLVVTTTGVPSKQMTFSESIAMTFFSKYNDFQGRASRQEFWWFMLFQILLSLMVFWSNTLDIIIHLVFLIPQLAVSTRRLHDTNKSGWWQLISLTIIGTIFLIIWWASKGSDQDNQYGKAIGQ